MSTEWLRHFQAAGYSTISGIVGKGFTFVLGSILLKYLESSALLGIINVRLPLLYTTLLFLAREPFRRACLGEVAKSKREIRRDIVNTIWLGFLLALLLAVPLAFIWRLNSPSQDDLTGTTVEDYHTSVLIICLSAIVEMLAEPCYIYAQAKVIADHNPKVEAVLVFLKSFLTAYIVWHSSGRHSSHILTNIACCHLFASSASVVYSYGSLCRRRQLSPTTFLPSITGAGAHLHKPTLTLSQSFGWQTVLKQLLTEGERYVMTFFNVISLSEQGIYDVVNNLGSLVPRLVFKPAEEHAYTLFSQTVSRTKTLDAKSFQEVQGNLKRTIKYMLLLGLTVLACGYNFVPLMVIYGGEKLNNPLAFHLMRWRLFYMPILAVNGITECFTFATMSTSEIRSYNFKLIIFSIVFLVSIYLTQPFLGSACFIFANCLTMLSRIFFSYRIIRAYFSRHGHELKLRDTIPSATMLAGLGGVFVFLNVISASVLLWTDKILRILSLSRSQYFAT